MKSYLEFTNESFGKVLRLEDLAELASRTQQPSMVDISKKLFLDILQKDLKTKGDNGVKRRFKEMTDLNIKPIIKGKYIIVYE